MKLALDLFTGSGSFEKVSRTKGFECISVDSRRRKGVCEPTLRTNLNDVRSTLFSSLQPNIIWAGLPCDIWSLASGGFHLDEKYNPKTEKAIKHLALFHKTTEIIKSCNDVIYFIENPRGKLNKYSGLIDFLKETNGSLKYCTLSSYGFPTTKPTMIATNFNELKLKELDPFGRGAKNRESSSFNNMTKVQRQKTPEKLISSVLDQYLRIYSSSM